jgi:hypothetical protein
MMQHADHGILGPGGEEMSAGILCLQGADGTAPQAGAAGAGGSAQRGPPQRSAADATQTQQPQQQQAAQKPLEANPLRGLGSAMERWRARLAVSSDAPGPPQVRTPRCDKACTSSTMASAHALPLLGGTSCSAMDRCRAWLLTISCHGPFDAPAG